MRRRNFIALLGSAAVAWPLAAHAQQHPPMGVPPPLPGDRQLVIGFLHAVTAAEYGLRRGLSEMGFVEGRNLAIDYRSTAGRSDRLATMAADLASRNVAVIISIDNDLATRAAMAATRSIPIVFTTTGSPVQLGFVASWNQPGATSPGSRHSAKSSYQSGWNCYASSFPQTAKSPCSSTQAARRLRKSKSNVLRWRLATSGWRLSLSSPAPRRKSKTPWQLLSNSEPPPSWSLPTCSFPVGANRSPCWRSATRYPRSPMTASLS